jgi:hypothetical protein
MGRVLAESSGRMGRTRTGRTASCLYGAEELEHTLALALSWVRAKVTADCTEGVCLELIPWDLGRGRHRELSLCARQISGQERERSNREPLRNSNRRAGLTVWEYCHVAIPLVHSF